MTVLLFLSMIIIFLAADYVNEKLKTRKVKQVKYYHSLSPVPTMCDGGKPVDKKDETKV